MLRIGNCPTIMRKRGRSGTKNLFSEISKQTFWVLGTFLLFITYLVEVRVAVLNCFGIYWTGIIDGILIMMVVFSGIFFVLSLKENKHAQDSP
jgi:hypothetical protein